MKKAMLLISLTLVFLFAISAVSAKTLIAGKIYNADFSETVAGASVTVTCNGNVQTDTSESDGSYSVTYDEIDIGSGSCDSGDALTVDASHTSYGIGSESGIIHDDLVMTLDIGVVNVPLVPEFGFLIGTLTIISAIGVFFFVRRQ
tara:strand:- start:53 stop:490 length:438 start_codon:yes stop_codon:yes gene_type:complete